MQHQSQCQPEEFALTDQTAAPAIETSKSGMILLSADGTIQACNASAEQILRLSAAQLQGRTLSSCPWRTLSEDGTPIADRSHPILVALQTGQPFEGTIGLEPIHGAGIWLMLNAQPLFQANASTPYAVVATFSLLQLPSARISQPSEIYAAIDPAPLRLLDTLESISSAAKRLEESCQQTEASLQHQQQIAQKRLSEIEAIYATAPVGLCFINPELKYVRINDYLAEINGFSAEAHIGKTLREILPDQADALEPLYQHVIETGVAMPQLEFHGVNAAKPGVERDWLVSLYPLKGNGDQVLGVNTTVQEITDRKQTEAEVARANDILRSVIDGTTDIIFLKDLQGRYLIANSTAAQWLGTTVEAMIDRSDADLFPVAIAAQLQDTDRQVIQSGESIVFEEKVPKQGNFRTLLSAKYPWRNAEGELLGVIGISRDITERKQAQEALRQSEERYRSLFESIDEGFCVLEVLFDSRDRAIDYRFVETNPAFERHTGLKNAVGKTARQLLPNLEEYWIETYGKVALTGESTRFENGSEAMNRWFDVFAFRFGQPNERKVALRFKDVSDRVRFERERERLFQQEQAAREQAETANRLKDQFLAVLSHELRTPLNPILGWTRLLRSGRLNAAKQAEALATIERNALLQTQLIEDLLDISRIMRGKLALNHDSTALAAVISAAVETVRLAADAKQIQLDLDLDPQVGLVSGDAGRLQQVVWNLLSNAVKFTPESGRVEIKLTQVEDRAQLQVIDTGKGINPEFLPYVFEYFRQEDGSTTRKFGGLGLGLAIARQIVEMHGGTIVADSKGEGHGTTFTVQLPIFKSVDREPLPVEINRSSLNHVTPLLGVRALVVDDDADAREFLTFLLKLNGAIVTTVDSAVQALNLIEQSPPDILLSDIGMPDMDGYALMRSVRQNGRSIPAIALTAYASELDQAQAMQVGFQRHITKPVDPDAVVKSVLELVELT